MELRLEERLVERVRAGALDAFPAECCGALIGRAEGRRVSVERLAPLPNVAAEPWHRYEADPRALLDLHLRSRREGADVVGYYHSHPSGDAVPSEADRRAAWPSLSYLICAIDERRRCRLRSWRLDGDTFHEERLVTVGRGAAEGVVRS